MYVLELYITYKSRLQSVIICNKFIKKRQGITASHESSQRWLLYKTVVLNEEYKEIYKLHALSYCTSALNTYKLHAIWYCASAQNTYKLHAIWYCVSALNTYKLRAILYCVSALNTYKLHAICYCVYLFTYSMEQSPSWEANWFCR